MRNLIIIALLTSASSGATVPDITDTTFATALGVDLSASALLSNGEYVRDLTNGTAVETNVGGTNYTFVLGAGTVISGIDQGLGAMNVGGTRQLIIPPALAYGDQGAGGGVIPSEAIVVAFVQITAAQ